MMVNLRHIRHPSSSHQQPLSGGDTVVEIEWDAVVQQFHQSFRETFSRSKKAHFDFLPPELRVVDGARDRWYPLLLLDAAWGLLWSNDFQFASKKAFNQRKVLYDSVVRVLRDSLCDTGTAAAGAAPSDDDSALPGWQWPSADSSSPRVSATPSVNAAMYAFAEDGSVRRVVHTLKDPVAFACARDAARSFSNLRTVFTQVPPSLPVRRVGTSTAGPSHSAGAGRTYCFPSPFASQAAVSSTPTAAAMSFDEDDSWCDVDHDAMYSRASPWATVRGFEALALSDPPAKSRSRFEAAVALLAAHALPLTATEDEADDVAVHGDSNIGELDALLHLVICKVLWHEAFVRRDATLRVAVRRLMTTPHRSLSSQLVGDAHRVAVAVDDNAEDDHDDVGGIRSTALSPLLWWVSTEETHMDDVPDAHRPRDTDSVAATASDRARSSALMVVRKRRRTCPIDSSADDSDGDDSDSDSDATVAKKKRRVGDPSDAGSATLDDEDVFMASFTAATHALDLWTPL